MRMKVPFLLMTFFFLLLIHIPGVTAQSEVQIPAQSDWTDQGVIASAGGSTDWDGRLVGGFSPCAAIKKDGTYFVYYIGATLQGRDEDNGPRYRALGVLTSTDGVTFTKYSGNPVITHWQGIPDPEESGIFTCGATIDQSTGELLMYVGAMTEGSPGSVNDDGKLYISSDGFNFVYDSIVLDHSDPAIWGSGDEIDPFGVFRRPSDNTWHMYYSSALGWDLAHISGPARN
ncbi:MAG: hypothetical protein JSV63_02685, partial [Candidatus Aenigmatarchaeota archaeon]